MPAPAAPGNHPSHSADQTLPTHNRTQVQRLPMVSSESPGISDTFAAADNDASFLTLPAVHDANADHVYKWPIVQSLKAQQSYDVASTPLPELCDATDIFILRTSKSSTPKLPLDSWRLLDHALLERSTPADVDLITRRYEAMVYNFFINVAAFYPIIHQDTILQYLHSIIRTETSRNEFQAERQVDVSEYCLLLLVLCLGDFAKVEQVIVPAWPLEPFTGYSFEAEGFSMHTPPQAPGPSSVDANTEGMLWQKALQLLSALNSEYTLEAAQCFALASIYLAAKGQAVDSHHYIQNAAMKCKMITKRDLLENGGTANFSDIFKRVFWVVYIIESDFASEFSIALPSGITIYEDIVPYPSSTQLETQSCSITDPEYHSPSSSLPGDIYKQSFSAYQISTNSAIRRFINRITAVMYHRKDTWQKKDPIDQVSWLEKIANELRSHHEALFKNLPSFLLSVDPPEVRNDSGLDDDLSNDSNTLISPSNHTWNVTRLRGRYFAGLYIIHRPIFEFAIRHPEQTSQHPAAAEIFESCRSCILGCSGFIELMFEQSANRLTGLFATGMATFTMVIILIVATSYPILQHILPPDVDRTIKMGLQNLRRYGTVVPEFKWHVRELEILDLARRKESQI
ncbi:hypothetical protein BP6252_11154 [Coleophoma cylindrospora]|uniref:Xylanolytic transcriptional activator regulatory domain-containing protein n=1 Tax=Coleophoma cylindrospora TaxID=1849047 RepID=A0A3D8QP84_9HELO|nr:hypothetical protein BP6252_11154 [Coleophoma cylindrospora]